MTSEKTGTPGNPNSTENYKKYSLIIKESLKLIFFFTVFVIKREIYENQEEIVCEYTQYTEFSGIKKKFVVVKITRTR